MKKRYVAAVGVAAVVGIGVAVSSGGSDDSVTPAPKTSTSAHAKTDERADLKTFKVDDRSQYGFSDVWLKWTITNSSSEKSDYSWDWEAVDGSGERVDSGTEFETNVLPGQTAHGETPSTLDTADVTINITNFDRTKAW